MFYQVVATVTVGPVLTADGTTAMSTVYPPSSSTTSLSGAPLCNRNPRAGAFEPARGFAPDCGGDVRAACAIAPGAGEADASAVALLALALAWPHAAVDTSADSSRADRRRGRACAAWQKTLVPKLNINKSWSNTFSWLYFCSEHGQRSEKRSARPARSGYGPGGQASRFDYVIAGGGLAGGLVALALAAHRRHATVALIEQKPRLGAITPGPSTRRTCRTRRDPGWRRSSPIAGVVTAWPSPMASVISRGLCVDHFVRLRPRRARAPERRRLRCALR